MAPWNRRARRAAHIANLPNALPPAQIASAQPLGEAPNILLRSSVIKQAWQDKARVYAKIGVVRFSFGLTANIISRCPTTAERLVDPAHDRWEPDDDPIPNSVLRTYRNPRDTGDELRKRHVWHYCTVGECVLTVEQIADQVGWFVYSTIGVQMRGLEQPVIVQDLPGGSIYNGGAREVPPLQVTRLWTPDEDYPMLATSPMVGILDDCERYTILGRRIKREAKSALGLNGIVFTPETAHQYPKDAEGKPSLYSIFDQDLAQIAQKSWEDDDNLAAVAPYSVHYGSDKETAVKPEWVKIGQSLDPEVREARREALEDIARGLPIPNVIAIEGTAGVGSNHWSAWLIQEDFFKGSIAPIADPVHHDDMTKAFFRPSLRQLAAKGIWRGNPDEWRVGYDPTPVIIHPDKATRAVELYKVGALSRLTTLLETGFGPEDAPTDAELEQFVKTQQALRATERIALTTPPDAGAPNTVEAPPPNNGPLVAAALAPYPSEIGDWLND